MQVRYTELNWEGAGYFGFPLPAGADPAWQGFERVLAAAKLGNFTSAGELIETYDDADSWLLAAACCDLLGDIGSRSLLESLRPAVTSILEPTYSVDLGGALATWGNLTVIDTLLETLEKIAEFIDAPALVHLISLLLEPKAGPLNDADGLKDMVSYAALARRRVNAIATRLGTTDVIVLHGDLFSVRRLVEIMRDRLAEGRLDPFLRHKFEATTGIDCSSFYVDERLQPLDALALLDDFEDRDGLSAFTPGRRYFFGHPIPD